MAEAEYDIIDVHCMVCKEKILPAETDMEVFRLGYQVHNEQTKPECIPALQKQIEAQLRGALSM